MLNIMDVEDFLFLLVRNVMCNSVFVVLDYS